MNKKSKYQYIDESYLYDELEDARVDYFQQVRDHDYMFDEWYFEWVRDVSRLRQFKIDTTLGIFPNAPTIGDILPDSLK